ncbi:MAG: phosphoadenylyl-sulfate reductase [Flavobacteriales bacterium]|jgi:phosphoadenosine phosphosulfate reductase|nr:phosphoadenylyl-sulfate reductase [Flavobacteriales bacterium]
MNKDTIEKISNQIESLSAVDTLKYIAEKHNGLAVFSTSFGQEDQVITDMILSNNIPIKIFTLDTGRMFEDTYRVMQRTNEKYQTKIAVYFPESSAVEKLYQEKGAYSFYESVENRKECCFIRKVTPLRRALSGNQAWITGLRAQQSQNRNSLAKAQYDENFDLLKVNPLINWSLEEVNQYLKAHNVPQNALHSKGFISIGCSPCTRAIKEGEDIRAGRWWWEDTSKKECGLHR